MRTVKYSDISIRITTFFLKNVGLWIAKDRAEKRRMRMMIAVTVFYMVFGAVTVNRDLYFTWLYKGDVLYSTTNLLSAVMSVVKLYNVLLHKAEFVSLIEYMQDNFWNGNYDFYEKGILDSCRKTCVFFVSLVTTIGICSITSYLITPAFVSTGSNESERLLPFNMWLKLPLSTTPYYEITYILQILALYYVGLCYFCFDNVFCIMGVHVAGQFRILQYRYAKILDVESKVCEKDADLILAKRTDESYEKLRDCIQQHQALIDCCEKLENVYTTIALGQVIIFSVLICLFGYQVLLAHCTFVRRIIFIWLIFGATVLLFMFTYSCDAVIEQSEKVAIGAYSAPWTLMPMNKSGRMFRNDLLIVLARCKRVCCLTASGFFPVSLKTYTTVLSTAASYFTLLRNLVQNLPEA